MRRRSATRQLAVATLLSAWFCVPVSQAQYIVEDSTDAEREHAGTYYIPYAFSTETLSTGVGLAIISSNDKQPQQNAFVTGYYTTNDSYALIGGVRDRRLFTDWLYFTPRMALVWNQDQRFYGDLFFREGSGGSGSNDSSPDDYVRGEGSDSYFDVLFRFILPIGDSKGQPLATYRTNRGILIDGETNSPQWNPFAGGRTFVEFKPFWQDRSVDVTPENINQFPPVVGVMPGDEAESLSNGLSLTLEYDNRDFPVNPVRGSHSKLHVERDFGWFDTTTTWTALDASFAKYFNIGTSRFFEQQVLALNARSAYSPTWEEQSIGGGVIAIDHRPPSNRGATLGGPLRMRAYPRGRFSDKAAIYYSAEVRLIPKWNPIGDWKVIRNLPWRWWQLAGFVEVGRVAPEWDLGTLHEDMKWSVGVGARAMIGAGVMRFDFAVSEESVQGVIFIDHAF
jgi:hypothetical protein